MQGSQQLIFIAVIIGVFYFLVIRPQQTRAKAQREMLSALAPGDEIVTIGGIFARVISVGERIRVALADGTEMEIAKQAVGQVLPKSDDEDAEDETDEVDEAEETEAEVADEDGEVAALDGETPADAPDA